MSPTKLTRLRGRRKFSRAENRQNIVDDAGTVQVSVVLLDTARGQHQKGNVTRSFRIQNCRVSEVAESLRKWLFSEDAPTAVPHVRLH